MLSALPLKRENCARNYALFDLLHNAFHIQTNPVMTPPPKGKKIPIVTCERQTVLTSAAHGPTALISTTCIMIEEIDRRFAGRCSESHQMWAWDGWAWMRQHWVLYSWTRVPVLFLAVWTRVPVLFLAVEIKIGWTWWLCFFRKNCAVLWRHRLFC